MKTVSDPYLLHLVGYVDCLNMQEDIVKMSDSSGKPTLEVYIKPVTEERGGGARVGNFPPRNRGIK